MTALLVVLVVLVVVGYVRFGVEPTRAARRTPGAGYERTPALPLSGDFLDRMAAGQATVNEARRFHGFDVIESPWMPPNMFLIGPRDGVRYWEDYYGSEPFSGLLRLREPLWEPRPPTWGAQQLGLADVATREREKALDHLAGLLDGLCDDVGLDREVWRAPRRAETAAAAYRRGVARYVAEERLALTIPNPRSFVVGSVL